MEADRKLSELGIPDTISRKLEELAIGGVRQFYARLQREAGRLQDYLKLSDEDFTGLSRKIESFIRDEYPEDLLPRIHPQVNKRGVAVHRRYDPTRPRYEKRGKG